MATRRALAPRSIHVRIVPRPSNLSESREILRVLKRFGQVSMFKYMKYEYQNPLNNVALAIFSDERAAQEAINASPIRFSLEGMVSTEVDTASGVSEDDEHNPSGKAGSNAKDNLDDITRPSSILSASLPTLPTSAPPTPASKPLPFDPPGNITPRKSWIKPFIITIDHSHAVQADFIERQPFYKQFNPMRSIAQIDLAKSVPHIGLSDVSKRPPGHFRTPLKALEAMRQYVDRVMPRLRDIGKDRQAKWSQERK